MARRTLGVSEARRLLPEIVRAISEEGGRVDVTVRGEPRVSIVRTADLSGRRSRRLTGRPPLPDALRVEFVGSPERLVEVVRDLRGRVGSPRRFGGRRKR